MKFRKTVLASAILAVMMVGAVSTQAAEDNWVMRPVEKLGRGIAVTAYKITQRTVGFN